MIGVYLKFMYLLFIQLLPGVKVVIANPETKGQCADSHLGEVGSNLQVFTHCDIGEVGLNLPVLIYIQ